MNLIPVHIFLRSCKRKLHLKEKNISRYSGGCDFCHRPYSIRCPVGSPTCNICYDCYLLAKAGLPPFDKGLPQ